MLSILVPIYNFNIKAFVKDLHQQCELAKINFEIICLDDGSSKHFRDKNSSIGALNHTSYYELEQNVGRSAIRNKLAQMASFNKLLFVDCDSLTEDQNFITNYIACINDHSVIYGGRTYDKHRPDDNELYLRWYYGIKREVKSAQERTRESYRNFMTNNFIINKQLVISLPFDEELTGYGYEDLAFSYRLKSNNIPIHHIDNNLRHIGLETNKDFLNKTANGMRNLAHLIQSETIGEDVKIYRFYVKCKRYRLVWLIRLIWKIFNKKVERNILGPTPNLRYLDLFKLHALIMNSK